MFSYYQFARLNPGPNLLLQLLTGGVSEKGGSGGKGKISEAFNGFIWSLKNVVFHNVLLNGVGKDSPATNAAKCKKISSLNIRKKAGWQTSFFVAHLSSIAFLSF